MKRISHILWVLLVVCFPLLAFSQPLNTDFKQAANNDSPYPLGDVHWIGSILQNTNSRYHEGMSVPQRLIFINIPTTSGNVHTLTLSHQASKGGKHAYDYMTSYAQALSAASLIAGPGILVNLNQCGQQIGPPANLGTICSNLYSGGNTIAASYPDAMPNLLGHSINTSIAAYEFKFGDRKVILYGNSAISSASISFNTYNGGSDKDAAYTLTWTSASTQILIELAGHLAMGDDVAAVGAGVGYGTGTGSGSISGGPFHFMLDELDGASLGQQDNQIMGGSIISNSACQITGNDEVCEQSTGNVFAAFTTLPNPTYSWAISGNGTINGSTTSSTVSVDAGAAGSFTLTVTLNGSTSCSKTVTVKQAATVDAGSDQTICAGDNVQLAGSFGGSATGASWTTSGDGSFNDATLLNAVYTPGANDIAAGTVTLTLTTNDPAGPCASVSDHLVVTINPPATADAGPDQDVCETSPTVTLAGSFGGSASSAAWSGGTGAFNPDNATMNAQYTPSAAEISAGSVTLTLTTDDPQGPCPAVSDAMVITIFVAATVDAGSDQTIGECNTVQLNGSIGGSAASATWTTSGDGTFNDATLLNAIYSPGTYDITTGTVTLTLTTNDPAGPCDAVSDQMVVTIILKPTCALTTPNPLPACGSSGNTLSGPDAPMGMTYSYSWSVVGSGWSITSSPLLQTITYTAGAEGSSATFTLVITDQFGCTGSCSLTMTLPYEYCSLTQGFFGNSGGRACATGQSTLALLNSLLSSGDLMIGRTGRSFTINSAYASCVITRLPAGGTPTTLPSGNGVFNSNCSSTTNIPLQNGKFRNVFLGQMITLGLNLRLDPTLGSLLLPSPSNPWLTTQSATIVNTICGDCGNGGDVANGSFQSYYIPPSVLTKLGSNGSNKTVNDLFSLANDGIGGYSISGTTLSDLNAAVSAFNNGFDKCRFFVGYSASPMPKAIVENEAANDEQEIPAEFELFDNYPNPFGGAMYSGHPTTTIRFALPEASIVQVKIFNMLGQLVAMVVDGELQGGYHSVQWHALDQNGSRLPAGMYTYSMRAINLETGKEYLAAKQMSLMK